MTKSKQQVSVLFMLFSILFCVCLIAANILETKQISVLGISLTGGLIVFPISYIINDCVCEVWGYAKSSLIDMAWLCNELPFLCSLVQFVTLFRVLLIGQIKKVFIKFLV